MQLGIESLTQTKVYPKWDDTELAYEHLTTSMECAAMLDELQRDITAVDNLIQIGQYLKQYGATEAFRTLIDDNGQIRALIGDDYSLERLDDAITGFFASIAEKFEWLGTRIGHKISTWFPTINRYEKLFNEGKSAIQGKQIDYEAVLDESVRGINASKLDGVYKLRKDGLDALKEAINMMNGGVDKVLASLDSSDTKRIFSLIVYKKDSLLQKMFGKAKLSALGYTAQSLDKVVKFGDQMFDLYADYEKLGPIFATGAKKASSDIRRMLNAGDKKNARERHKNFAQFRAFIVHLWSYYSVALDQMEDEAAFAAYTIQKMKKHIK